MPYGSGLGASLGFGVESTVGTEVTPTNWYEILDHSLQQPITYLDGAGLKAGQAFKRSARTAISKYDVNGDVSFEHGDRGVQATGSSKGMSFLWKYALGSTLTTGVVESGSAYRHVHTPGVKDGASLTGEVGSPQTASPYTAIRFGYAGLKVSQWEFTCNDGQLAQLKLSFDGWRETTTGSITTPAFSPSTYQPSIFSFADASTFLIGTGASTTSGSTGQTTLAGTAAVATVVKGITLTGITPVAGDRYGLGNAGVKREQLQNGVPTLTGTLDAEFTNRTEFYDLFAAGSTRSLQLDFTHYIAGVDAAGVTGGTGANPFRLSFILPAVKFKTGQVKLNGADLLTQTIGFEAYDDASNPVIQVKLVTSDQGL